MSVTIMPNAITTGVRRLQTLGAMWGLGTPPDQTTIAELVANGGYDMGTINMLIDMGATNEQLQALPYPAGADERAAAITNLVNVLSGAQAAPGQSAVTAKSYPQSAIPIVQTDIGPLDLSLRSTWDGLASQFAQIGQQLNAIAAQNPNDPTAIQMRSKYNSLARQFSDAWSKVFNSASPIQTLGDWQDIAVGTGLVVIGGILVASGVGIPLVAGIVGVAAGLAVLVKWINSQNAATAVTGQIAKNAGDIINNPNLTPDQKTALLKAAGSPSGAPPTNWNVWLQQNAGLLIAALAAIVIVPPLLRRR